MLKIALQKIGCFGFIFLALTAYPAVAETLKGRIEVVDTTNSSLVLAGITFQADANTQYSGNISNFSNLEQGQTVFLDFDRKGNRYIIKNVKASD